MPTKPNRKPNRKPRHAKRASNGRFKGQPRTLSETVMPEEYAPATEVPREQPWAPDPVVVTALVEPASRCYPDGGPGGNGEAVQRPTEAIPVGESAESGKMSAVDISETIASFYGIRTPRPWYRRLWEWLR